MRIVDPQSALLTNAEVYDFLKHHNPRKQDKKIGAYEPVDLKGYKEIRQDVLRFGKTTTPQLLSDPRPQKYMKTIVEQLRKHDLTKTEVYTIINLALGFPQTESAMLNGESDAMENDHDTGPTDESPGVSAQVQIAAGDANPELPQGEEGHDDLSGMEVLGLIIDSLEERFPEDTREERMAEMLAVLRDCVRSVN